MRHVLIAIGFITSKLHVAHAQNPVRTVQQSDAAQFRIEVAIDSLTEPVALAFLRDGRALVAERAAGVLGLWDGRSKTVSRVEGLPPIMKGRNGSGLLDVVLHPRYQENGWVYIAYSDGSTDRSTLAVDRLRIERQRVMVLSRIFTADAYAEDHLHYGGRLAFAGGFLFVAVGDRHHQDRAQDLRQHAGTIVRLHDDGRVPTDNPFVGRDSVRPEVWSYGHRNIQGLVVHPESGEIWSNEHGPLGGDELNIVRRSGNYGWPVISYGWGYEGGPIRQGIVAKEGMEQPLWVWTPSIAPSGMAFYSGAAFPQWRGSLLIGSLGRRHLNRIVIREGRVVVEERMIARQWGRIRCVAEGPDGFVYLCSDDGRIVRLRPP